MCVPCPVCNNQKFQTTESLRISLIKAANGPITCAICNEIFMGLDKFTIHLFSHCEVGNHVSNEPPSSPVEVPPALSPTAETSTNSIVPEGSDRASARFQCKLCSKKFHIRGSLKVHMKVVHSVEMAVADKVNNGGESNKCLNDDPIKMWECDICHKMFTTKYFLKKHKRLHTGETPYNCEQCGKTFTFQQSYHKHLLYHSDDKPYICQNCGRAFKELSTLHNHERIHSGEKPFECETCGKCFRQRVSYLVHKRIHTGVMPYKCQACSKTFRYKVTLKTHKCTSALAESPTKKEDIEPIQEHGPQLSEFLNFPATNTKKDEEFDVDEFIAQSCDKMGILEHEKSVSQFAELNISNNDGFGGC